VTVDPEISISGGQEAYDSEEWAADYTVTSEVGTPTSYEWSFDYTPGAGNNPLVNFSAPSEALTMTDAHWYAYPNGACTAQGVSTYWIIATVGFQYGATSDWTYLWVDGWWDPAGVTLPPWIESNVAYTCQGGTCWVVDQQTQLVRHPPGSDITVPTTSQFYEKARVHEEVHYNQYGPGGINADLYNPAELRQQLLALKAGTEQQLLVLIEGTVNTYHATQAYIDEQMRWRETEAEAHAFSDTITPEYVYQNCGRY
jgi:hypothetical protein